MRANEQYEAAINALIPIAEREAKRIIDAKTTKRGTHLNKDAYNGALSAQFHMSMNRLAAEAGLRSLTPLVAGDQRA